VFCVLLAKRAAVLEVQCGLLLRAKVPAKPLVHAQEGRYSSPLSAPHTSCAVATFSLHAVRQMDTRSLSVEVTYFLCPLSLKLLPCLSSIYLSFKRFLCSLFHLLPPSYLFHSLPLSLSLSLSGVTQQLCTESCIPHPSRREVRQLITHTHVKITGFEPSDNH
jgi:hypothetical protein